MERKQLRRQNEMIEEEPSMDVQFDLFKDRLHELYENVRTVQVDSNSQSYRLEQVFW